LVTVKSTTQITNVSRPVTVATHIERSQGNKKKNKLTTGNCDNSNNYQYQ
jgi:hypothetical protein